MTDELDPATVLEEAADLLLIHGRNRGQTIAPDGSLCILGAIERALGQRPMPMALMTYDHPARIALERHLAKCEDPDAEGRASCWGWNDRTDADDEVRDTLLLVAKDLRNEAQP
jgi:hypothetical protein